LPAILQTTKAALPGAIAVGPQKTGTTWVHEYLAARGDVALPRRVKEVNFFSRYYDRGLGWYARQFTAGGEFALTAEISPGYFDHPDVPSRIVESLGRVRILITLRHPAERLHSLWIHMLRYGMTTLPFRDAIQHHPELLATSRYGEHLQRWLDAFGSGNVTVLFLEDLRRDSNAFTRNLCACLGLDHLPVPANLESKVNEASLPQHSGVARVGWKTADFLRSAGMHGMVEGAKSLGLKSFFFGRPGASELPVLGAEDRRWILEQLAGEIELVEELLGRQLPAWRR
jgi:hypothetical protein